MWEFHVDDGLVLARPDVQGLFLLNSSARLLWEEVRKGTPTDRIILRFVAEFGISTSVARQDIETALVSWRATLLAPPVPPLSVQPVVTEAAEVRPLDCLVNGRAMRVYLEIGDVWDEIAPRLQPVVMGGLLAECTFHVTTAGAHVHVFQDGKCIGSDEITAGARAILLQAMASPDEPAAILHAGGCGGVLLAGQSHSGKSTLSAALMSRGLPYHCDDSAVLDREFRVAAMPFPLMLRRNSWPVLEARIATLRDSPVYERWGTEVRLLAPVSAPCPSSVTALVFVAYEAAAETSVAALSVLDTLFALQRSGFWVEHTRESIARFLMWLAGIRRRSLRYSRLEEAECVIGALAANTPG